MPARPPALQGLAGDQMLTTSVLPLTLSRPVEGLSVWLLGARMYLS